jgi:hypothetical protein
MLKTGQSLGQVDAPAPAGIQLGERPISCRGYHGPLTGANRSSLVPNEPGVLAPVTLTCNSYRHDFTRSAPRPPAS